MDGIVDVIALLLGLSGFGLQPNAKPPTADASLQYAIADADLVVHFDAASVVPGNYRKLVDLPNQATIQQPPEVAKLVRKAVTEADSARGLVKTMTGIDVTTDVADATLFVQARAGGGNPNALFAVHGKFNAGELDKIAGIVKKPVIKLKTGAAWLEVDDRDAVAITADGVLLFGSRDLLSARTQPGWKAPAHAAGTSLGYAYDMLGAHPVFGVSVTLSQTARDAALAGNPPTLVADLIKRGKAFSLAVYHDGIGWTWYDTTKPGLDAMAEMSNGLVEVLRAAQIAPRGVSKIALGALESYRSDPHVDELLRHKAELQKLIDAYIGDGTFKAKVDADAKTLKLSARLTGKTTSEVVPFGVIVPMGIAGFFVMAHEESRPTPTPLPTTKRK